MSRENLAELVAQAAARRPDSLAVSGPGGSLSWAELDRGMRSLAGALAAAGLNAGDRVALLLGNQPAFPLAYFAALHAGLVVVPLNTGYTAAELTQRLADSGARLLVTAPVHAELAEAVRASVPGLERVLVAPGEEWDKATTTHETTHGTTHETTIATPAPVGGGEQLAVLLYTSGTSGHPKGAMLSHRALLANVEQMASLRPCPISEQDAVLVVIPLFHVYGLNTGLGLVARQAATAVLVERFDPVETLRAVGDYGVTAIVGAPPMYVAWSMLPDLASALRDVRLAISGAAPLSPAVLTRLRESTGMAVYEGYGLTETAPVLTTTLASATVKAGSIGQAVPGVQLRLRGEGDEPIEDDDPGEITVRGPNLFSGYWPDGAGGPDADGWFRTGDVAYADQDGDLFLVDRLRDLILVSGFNVFPREVEEVLARHPDVAEVAVMGIPHPYTGESVTALVVARPGTAPTAEELIDFCARSLARFKCPTSVRLISALPHSATGKVSKGRLREEQAERAAVIVER